MDEKTLVIEISDPRDQEPVLWFDPLNQPLEKFKDWSGFSVNTKRKISKATAETQSAESKYYEMTGYGLLDVATPPYNFVELASFFDYSPINHAAVMAKVSNIVGLGYNFEVDVAGTEKLESSDGESKDKVMRKIDRTKAELNRWLESLNDDETIQYVLEKVATDYETFGNGYIEIGRTIRGDIGYLGHIPASTVWVRNKKDGFVQIVGKNVTFFNNFGVDKPSPVTPDRRPNQLIHFKKYSPRSTFYGVPDSVACAVAIKGDSLASQHNVKYFDNSATPRYICTLSGGRLSKTAEDKLFKFLQTSLRGNPHRTLFIPLPNDPQGNPIKFEMHRVDDDVHDGSWENYRERNKQDILTAHGVPMSRIGGSDDKGTAQSLSADRMFKEQIVVPNQELFEKMLNKVVREKTDIVRFNLNELSLTDELAQSQIDERYVRNQVMKINEARNNIGLPSVPDGDKFFEPKPQVTAEQNAQAGGTRTRDQQRTANNSDSSTTVSGRNPKGAGSKE
jgi:PBSX family phage portal protein